MLAAGRKAVEQHQPAQREHAAQQPAALLDRDQRMADRPALAHQHVIADLRHQQQRQRADHQRPAGAHRLAPRRAAQMCPDDREPGPVAHRLANAVRQRLADQRAAQRMAQRPQARERQRDHQQLQVEPPARPARGQDRQADEQHRCYGMPQAPGRGPEQRHGARPRACGPAARAARRGGCRGCCRTSCARRDPHALAAAPAWRGSIRHAACRKIAKIC